MSWILHARSKTQVGRHFTSLLAVMALLYGGCGTWVGTPKKPTDGRSAFVALTVQGAKPGLNLQAASVPVIAKSGQPGGTLTLSSALVALKEIELKLDVEDSENEGEFPGPYTVDLLANSISPDPGAIEVPEGAYGEIKLKLDKLEGTPGVSPTNPLYSNTIYLSGTFSSPTGETKPFTMSFELEEDLSLGSQSAQSKGTNLVGDTENLLIIAFRMSKWFDFSNTRTNPGRVDLSDITGPVIDLTQEDDGIGEDIRRAIKEAVKQSADFGRDEDGDGKLSKTEDNDSENDSESEDDTETE